MTAQALGFRELEARLRNLPNRTRKSALTRTLTKSAEPMRSTAQENAPKRSGDLARSPIVSTRVTARQRGLSRDGVKSTAEISIGPSSDGSTGVFNYAHLAEFGWGGRPGTAWLTRAYEQHKAGAVELIRRDLATVLEKALRRQSGVSARGG